MRKMPPWQLTIPILLVSGLLLYLGSIGAFEYRGRIMVMGYVLDGATHRPIPFADIRKSRVFSQHAWSNTSGYFLYEDKLYGDLNFNLSVSADGYQTVRHGYRKSIEDSADSTVALTLIHDRSGEYYYAFDSVLLTPLK